MTDPELRDIRSPDWGTASTVALVFHGYGSDEVNLSGLVPALDLEISWASLRAPLELGNGGAAWFTITTPGNPDAAPVVEATDAIWRWVDVNVDPSASIIAIGFSQGGLMASQLLRTRPERVRATVILGGFVLGASQATDDSLSADRPPVFWGRGADDRVIADIAIERTAAFLPAHSTLVEKVYPGLAHGINADEVVDVREFLAGLVR